MVTEPSIEKKLVHIAELVLQRHNTLFDPNIGVSVSVQDAEIRMDAQGEYYFYVNAFIQSSRQIHYNAAIENLIFQIFNKVSKETYDLYVNIKVRDYVLRIDLGHYEILYTKTVRKKQL